MVNQYKLVNPYIKGEFETKLEANNSIDAAKTFYKNLSEHFNNNVPTYYFTIQKGGSKGKFYSFKVKESKKNDEVNYSITPFKINNEEVAINQFVENFTKFKGRFNGGGKRGSKRGSKRRSKRSESESESSESDSYDFYREAKSYVPASSQPMYYMYYDPLVYRVNSVFLPTLYPYCSPYCEFASYLIYP